MHHQLTALEQSSATFSTPIGPKMITPSAIILALGGASWPQTGSDGNWTKTLNQAGIPINPLSPANCGWETNWPHHLIPQIEAQPIKNIIASTPDLKAPGELMITKYGLEGGPIYLLGPSLRSMPQPTLTLDLKPTFSIEQLTRKMESARKNFLRESIQRWKLPIAATLLLEHFHGPFESASQLAHHTKSFKIPLQQPRPIDEAISSAGGIPWPQITPNLMLKKLPGTFVAGEMIDWEAPTGGYLLQGAFASGTIAAQSAIKYLQTNE